ncbi:retinoid-inducible serine carboxypeptidase-like [Nylanderia fulva]|uniref:retinoid-inducible serine carboxypeptidase-like n=1 Tax=Nylanderia fulva TaxID=613905 RepID=UPI0010FB3F47|nr:retinoid-inducible serine carboxypeptidase-like [Nylanderia fulva]
MMKRLLICIFAIFCFIPRSTGRKGFGPGEQEWGYVEVRPNAHMFWWLYYTTADVKSYYDKPLIIWLQGGPGGSSTAYGNFEELGPLDLNLNPRNYTWIKSYNVLFIDNPVGTGFSYVNDQTVYTTTNAQIARDLIECIRGFYKQLPRFKFVPTYIISESYGGKMGAEFALVWARAQKVGNIKSNLKGVVLGGAWISPIDSVTTLAPFLCNVGMMDLQIFKNITSVAKLTKAKVKSGEWEMATKLWSYIQKIIAIKTYVNFYNIVEEKKYGDYSHLLPQSQSSFNRDLSKHRIQNRGKLLYTLMNGQVREALGLNVIHGHNEKIFYYLREDFMKPVTNIVELLLNETNLKVFVYNGNLDAVVTTKSTYTWIEKLKWKKADTWKYDSIKVPLVVEGIIEGYVKATDNFAMYLVYRAGHHVPKDNPAAMALILQDLIKE